MDRINDGGDRERVAVSVGTLIMERDGFLYSCYLRTDRGEQYIQEDVLQPRIFVAWVASELRRHIFPPGVFDVLGMWDAQIRASETGFANPADPIQEEMPF